MSTRTRVVMGLARRLPQVAPAFWAARLRNPVFVIGFSNSGKSTLMRAIGSLPGVSLYPDEGNSELWFPGLFPWRESRLDVQPIWCDPSRFVAFALERQSAGFLHARAQLGAYQWLSGSRWLLNDSGMLASLAPDLLARFPDARFVHFLRDGYVSAYITARLEWAAILRSPGRYKAQNCPLDFGTVLERMARYWAWTIARVDTVASRLPGRVLELRYEDWCRQPGTAVKQVSEFLRLRLAAHAYPRLDPIEDLEPFVRGETSAREAEILDAAMGAMRAQKGYG